MCLQVVERTSNRTAIEEAQECLIFQMGQTYVLSAVVPISQLIIANKKMSIIKKKGSTINKKLRFKREECFQKSELKDERVREKHRRK